MTNVNETECYSTHLTTFAGGCIVSPSPINWDYVFSNADLIRNKMIYLTISCVLLIYLLSTVYARHKDKNDLEKRGVNPLDVNYNEDQYSYEIFVFTGHRKDSQTRSKVQFVMNDDDNDETKVRTFSHSHRRIFQRDGVDELVMTVPELVNISLCFNDCIRVSPL